MQSIGRRSCEAFLESIRQDARFYAEFANDQVIVFSSGDGNGSTQLHPHILPSTARERLHAMGPLVPQDVIKFWALGQLATQGPKVFQPNLEQCLAMEQIAPRVALADYAQPYPVLLVELPEDYRRLRVCPSRNSRYVGMHAPEFVLTAFPPFARPFLYLHVVFGSGTTSTMTVSPDDPTIEARIVHSFGAENYIPVDGPTPEEGVVLAGVFRLAANAMLVMMQYGCKQVGPANASHYQRLQHHLTVARKRRERVAEAERALRLATQLVTIRQDIVLHKEASDHGQEAGESAARRRPHWRRGHWKMQPYGPGKSLRKRVLRKPVLVNRHLLAGEDGESLTMYRMR